MSAYGTIAGPARMTMPDGVTPLLYNPGVVTEYDRAQAWATLTCPFCGKVEPNEMLLANNHWLHRPDHTGFDWCRSNGMCISQQLITNHIGYYAKALRNRDANATGFRKFDESKCRAMLADAMEHGAAVGIDGSKIVAFFTAVTCLPCEQDRHGECFTDTTWSTVLEDLTTCDCKEESHG